jgi:hypothetical protein
METGSWNALRVNGAPVRAFDHAELITLCCAALAAPWGHLSKKPLSVAGIIKA